MAKREIEMKPIDDNAERNQTITRVIITKPKHLNPNAGEGSSGEVIGTRGNVNVHGGTMEAPPPPLTNIQKRIGMALRNGRWDVAVRGLGYRELEELTTELNNVRRMVRAERERQRTAAVKEESPSKCGHSGI